MFLDGKRDTYLFQRGEKASLVFIADNPGFWLFHCHMLEHHAAGMGAVIHVLTPKTLLIRALLLH